MLPLVSPTGAGRARELPAVLHPAQGRRRAACGRAPDEGAAEDPSEQTKGCKRRCTVLPLGVNAALSGPPEIVVV